MPDITRGVRAFTIGTAISRVLGLIRESVFAFLFGAGTATDAFNAAFRIPNLFRDLFAETALSAAFIPVLAAEKQKGKQQQNRAASNMFNILLLATGALVLIGIIFAPFIVRIVAFGFGRIPNKIALTSVLTSIMFPFLLFIALAAWSMGYLNTEQKFFVPSLAPALFNVFSIAAPLTLYAYFVHRGMDPIYSMAIGVLVGGFMQFAIQVPHLYKQGFRYHLYLNFRDPAFKKIMTLFLPVAIGLAASRINVTVDTVLISMLAERSMTWLNYAYRIMHLPLGLFGIAVGTVALPTLSSLVAAEKHDDVRVPFIDSLKLVLFLTVSTSIIIAFLALPITRLIYERGRFMPVDTTATMQALILYVIGIPFVACVRNIAALYYAYNDAKTPMYASFAAVGVNIILNLSLMYVIGFRAFPLATTLSSLINVTILLIAVKRKIKTVLIVPLLTFYGKLIIPACLAGGAGLAISCAISKYMGMSLIVQIGAVIISGMIAGFCFYGGCLVVGIRDAKAYVKRLIKR
jgi:putative peptidoglycan lipid II flippase